MTKTTIEVVSRALRRLGVLSGETSATADEMATGQEVLAGLKAELTASHGLTFAWADDAVPDALYLPLAYLLAVDLAAEYEVPPRDSRSHMIGRLRAQQFPDDREDSRDLDDDGTVSESEEHIGERAVYY